MKIIVNHISKKMVVFFSCLLVSLTTIGCNGTKSMDQAAQITLENAEEMALADAGLTTSDITSIKTKMEQDDGISVYDVEFYTDNVKYEYEVDAGTGTIYSRSKETFIRQETVQDGKGQAADSQGQENQNNESQNSVTQDNESQNNTAQNSEQISPNTNQEYHLEHHDGNTRSLENDIGVEEAKNIAVGHAGFAYSDVRFTKAEFDWEDGQAVYEVEFYKDAREYDYTINASTGTVLEYEID